MQPSPDRSGLEEAESDVYFLGHVFTDSQLKLGSLPLPFHCRTGDVPEVSAVGDVQSCWGGTASSLGLCWVSGSQEGMQAGFWQARALRDTRDSDRTAISSGALAQCQGLVWKSVARAA